MTVLSSDNWLAIFMIVLFAAVIWIAVFRRDQFDAYKDRPDCFGSDPGPQQAAENDCETCPEVFACRYCGCPTTTDPADQSPPLAYCDHDGEIS